MLREACSIFRGLLGDMEVEREAVFARVRRDGLDSVDGDGADAVGRCAYSDIGLAGRGGRGAKGGRGSGNGRHGLRGAGGHDGEGNPAGLPGSKQSLPVVSTKGLSYPTITATPSKQAAFTRHSAIRVSSAYSKDYAEPPLASEQNKVLFPVLGGHRARHAVRLASRRNTIGLPTFTGSFRAVGNSWRYTMVGSAPSAGSKTTKVQVVVVPVNVDFGGQRVLDAAAAVKQIEMSPIFQPAQFTSGTTQYVDAMQRAEFWTVLQHKAQNYHLLLDPPITTQPWTFHVPASLGLIEMSAGSPVGLAEIGSWDAALRELVSTELDVQPNTLVITVSATNELFQNGCCIGGYRTAYPTPSGVDTAIWADVPAPGQILGITSPNNDVAISHEVEEWANDPYGDNQVPVAIQPGTNQCGLQLLEVGDAVEALPHPEFGVPLNGQVYQVQDVAGVSWFADQKPSMEQNGLYSYDGKLTGPAKYCVGG